MSVAFARPDVSELCFRLYSRSVHPELLSVQARQEIALPAMKAELCICDAGHAIRIEWGNHLLTEITSGHDQPLPKRRTLIERRMRGQFDSALHCADQLHYHNSFHVEHLSAEVFMNLHQELLEDCSRVTLSHRFRAGSRLAPEPLSLIRTEAQKNSLLIHAFHTFPENTAVVRTQSLFELD